MTMDHSLALAILLVAMCRQIESGTEGEDDGSDIDIREALNTSEPLWLFWQSDRNSFPVCSEDYCINETETCIRNVMIDISSEEYYFNQAMLLNGVPYTTGYIGEFNDGKTPPKSMEVREVGDLAEDSGSGLHQLWVLQYLEPGDHRCMVFFIQELEGATEDDLNICEMYIKGKPQPSDPPSGCRTFFKARCNATQIYKPYSTTCKEVVKLTDTTANSGVRA
uniref:Lipocalin/cytosolic fatty-acid binding domain-containing protein n=1 Tax=Amblyomma maculatum TaxID=34609 RepID=G3MPV7_AMBMU